MNPKIKHGHMVIRVVGKHQFSSFEGARGAIPWMYKKY